MNRKNEKREDKKGEESEKPPETRMKQVDIGQNQPKSQEKRR